VGTGREGHFSFLGELVIDTLAKDLLRRVKEASRSDTPLNEYLDQSLRNPLLSSFNALLEIQPYTIENPTTGIPVTQ